MPRYAAFLRGVSPLNAKMADVRKAFESAGFTDVKTVLSSGNVVFSARGAGAASLERKVEAAMLEGLGRTFLTIVRSVDALYRAFRVTPAAKRIVTFLRAKPAAKLALPIAMDGARLLSMKGQEVFSTYLPNPKGPVFMTLIEKTLGKEQTTRTWETVRKVARG